ncbi:MAG: amidohydrolase family protein [Cyclobacteriaceae bacterium]
MSDKTSLRPQEFVLNPAHYGVPDLQQLKDLRIWDSHYHGLMTSGNPLKQHKEMMFYVERMGIERVISLDIGGTLKDPLTPQPHDGGLRAILERDKAFISGIIPIDPGFPDESSSKIKDWIQNGPCIGIKYVGGNKLGITCDHPNNDKIIQLAADLAAMIYIHSWLIVGGTPRLPGGSNQPGESTPMNVAALAKRFPNVPIICGHSGGDWELGVKAIRPFENVFLEFSGSDPHSGSVDYAVKELGGARIVWGGHGPGRSFSTELSKVLDASISHSERMKIFGGNYRRLAQSIFRKKGITIQL